LNFKQGYISEWELDKYLSLERRQEVSLNFDRGEREREKKFENKKSEGSSYEVLASLSGAGHGLIITIFTS
jgi:hypothetical protein